MNGVGAGYFRRSIDGRPVTSFMSFVISSYRAIGSRRSAARFALVAQTLFDSTQNLCGR